MAALMVNHGVKILFCARFIETYPCCCPTAVRTFLKRHRHFKKSFTRKCSLLHQHIQQRCTLNVSLNGSQAKSTIRESFLRQYFLPSHARRFCSLGSEHDLQEDVDPYEVAKCDLSGLHKDIRMMLATDAANDGSGSLAEVSQYYFGGEGKCYRPLVTCLMARAVNAHLNGTVLGQVSPAQRRIAMISEMIHAASLVHDDVIDCAARRRGLPTVSEKWGQQKAVLAGTFVLSRASIALAELANPDVVVILSQVLEDLVRGEFMQMGSRVSDTDRFNHYLEKTYKKTASLIALSCKAVAVLSDAEARSEGYSSNDPTLADTAYDFGRNLGMAFQLVDDLLDFTGSESTLGKPTSLDLKLGLATAPVLFAAQSYPELSALIMRRFKKEGDVLKARELVMKSDGVRQTKMLAQLHCQKAVKALEVLSDSQEKRALVALTSLTLSREK